MIDVQSVLTRLGIKYSSNDIKGNQLLILCPFHNDKSIGSFSINIKEWKFNCFSCSSGGVGPETFISKYLKISWKEAHQWLIDESFISNDSNHKNKYDDYTDNLAKNSIEEFLNKDNKNNNNSIDYLPDKLERIDADEYYYLISHNISQVFIDTFKWFYSTSGFYKDYIIVPIYFNNKLVTFETRKLLEYEKLCEFYREKFLYIKEHYKILKNKFKDENYKLKNNIIYQNNEQVYIRDKNLYFLLKYLLMPKVLYPKNSDIHDYIYNYDNLDKNKTLYLVESNSSICNIWENISENVTAIMGANLTDNQIKLLNEFENIVFYPDDDEAGLIVIEKLLHGCTNSKIQIVEIKKPLEVEIANKEELLKEGESIGKFVYRKLRELNND